MIFTSEECHDYIMNNILEQLKEITSSVIFASESRDLEVVLERIADIARELVKTKYAALGIPDGKGGLTYFKTSGMTAEEESSIAHLPHGHGLIGAIMRERKVIRLDKMDADSRSAGFPDNHPFMTSFLGAPVMVANHLYGMLYLTEKIDGTPFTKDDETLVEVLAGYAALAISGAQLNEKENQLKLLQERERIGMELHDGVIQSLYGIGMNIDIMQQSKQHANQDDLNRIVNNLNDVIEDIRAFIGDLRKQRNELTVLSYLEHLKERLHPPETIGISIQAEDNKPPFLQSTFEAICLIANEAMSNAIRHANATEIIIKASQSEDIFSIVVEDNGEGFDVAIAQASGGLGLLNMQQRAQMYEGDVHVSSELGQGTKLEIIVPIKDA